MHQDPEARFGSAEEMAAALAAATEATDAAFVGEPTVASPAVTFADIDSTRVMAVAEPPAPHTPAPADPAPEVVTRRRFAMGRMQWLLAAAVVAVLLVAVIWSTRDSNPGAQPLSPTPSSSAAPTSSIPAPLNDAIDDLERAVEP
jgi:hypothetical protein